MFKKGFGKKLSLHLSIQINESTGFNICYGRADVGKWALLAPLRIHHVAKIYRKVIKGTAGTW